MTKVFSEPGQIVHKHSGHTRTYIIGPISFGAVPGWHDNILGRAGPARFCQRFTHITSISLHDCHMTETFSWLFYFIFSHADYPMTYIIFVLLTRHAITTTPACLPACLLEAGASFYNEWAQPQRTRRTKEGGGRRKSADWFHPFHSVSVTSSFVHPWTLTHQ